MERARIEQVVYGSRDNVKRLDFVDNIIDHVKVLNSRVEAGEALILGDFSFQSEAELLTFVTEEFPQYTFGVFYDTTWQLFLCYKISFGSTM